MSAPSLERDAGDAERQRRIGEHTGDHDLLAVEQSHAERTVVRARLGRGEQRRCAQAATLRRCASESSAAAGPAGVQLAARLASVGYEVVIGSRSKYRAMEARDELVAKWPELDELLGYGDNAAAADCDWSSSPRRGTRRRRRPRSTRTHLRGKVVVSMANALVRVGQRVPAARAATRQRRRPRAGGGAGVPRRRRVPPPARRRSSAASVSRSTPTC